MSYHIGLFDDICLQRWVGFGHWDRVHLLRFVPYTFSLAQSSGKGILNIEMELFVYYLSLSGFGSLGDVSVHRRSNPLWF